MRRALLIRPEAEADLQQAYQWYEQQRAGLGDDFLARVDAALTDIRRQPQRFPTIQPEVRRALVKRFPYAIFFVVSVTAISILAVFHCRRDHQAWLRRRSRQRK